MRRMFFGFHTAQCASLIDALPAAISFSRLLDPIQPLLQRLALHTVEAVVHRGPQLAEAVVGVRVGLEQQRHVAVALREMADLLQHRRQAERVVAGTRGEHYGDAVGLEFGLLVERARHDLRAAADQSLHFVAAADVLRDELAAEVDQLALLQDLQMMLADHVADFMGQHPGQLGLALQQAVQAARDEDIAAGRGEGVHVVRIDHAEVPGQVGALALVGDPAADVVDVFLQLCVLDQGCRAEQVAGDLPPDRDLLLDRGRGLAGHLFLHALF